MPKAEQSREHIMLVAMQLFSERGYHKTTTEGICKKAGISTGLLFYHFGSKEKLLKTIIRMTMSRIEETLAVEEEEDPASALEKIIDAFFNSLKEDSTYWDLYMSLLYHPDTKPHILKEIRSYAVQFRRRVYDLLEKMGVTDPAGESFEFEVFRVGVFASYLTDHNDKMLDHAKARMRTRYLPGNLTGRK